VHRDLKTGLEELLGEWEDPDRLTGGGHARVAIGDGAVEARNEDFGHTWHVSAWHRTKPGGTGCPACAGEVVTATDKLQAWCGNNGREDVLEEWAHPDKAPQDFFLGSAVKVPWECGKCGWE